MSKPRNEAFDAQVMTKDAVAQDQSVLVIVSAEPARAIALARKLAEQQAVELSEADLLDLFQPWDLQTRAVIFREWPQSSSVLARLKTWVTDGTMRLNKKHQAPVEMPTPKFFFCTTGAVDGLYGDHRFHVVNLND